MFPRYIYDWVHSVFLQIMPFVCVLALKHSSKLQAPGRLVPCFYHLANVGYILCTGETQSVFSLMRFALVGFAGKQTLSQFQKVNLWSFLFQIKFRKSLISSIYQRKIYDVLKVGTNKRPLSVLENHGCVALNMLIYVWVPRGIPMGYCFIIEVSSQGLKMFVLLINIMACW